MRPVLDDLRERLGSPFPDRGCFFTRSMIDALMPGGSFRRGTLVEFLGGGTSIATVIARAALRPQGVIVVVDSEKRFYPPAATQLGIDLARLIVVQSRQPDWIITQALSCPAVDAVLYWPCKVDSVMFRRWQLAAERGGSIGLLARPTTALHSPSWAQTRIVVQALGLGHWRLAVVNGPAVEVKIDDEGHIHDRMHLVSQLADSTLAPRTA